MPALSASARMNFHSLNLVQAAWFIAHVTAICRMNGCDEARTFHLNATAPAALSVAGFIAQPQLQCIANLEDLVVCTSVLGGPSWNQSAIPGLTAYSADSNTPVWNSTEIFSSTAFAFSDLQGNVFASDGFVLVATSAEGQPLGQPIIITPVLGDFSSLTATHNQVFVLPAKHGDIATYLSNGVPLGALWLNDTQHNEYGTYVSAAPAVVYQSRFYLATQFQSVTPTTHDGTACRLYAVDVHRTLVGKMIVAWNVDYICPSRSQDQVRSEATILRSQQTICVVVGDNSTDQDSIMCVRDQSNTAQPTLMVPCNGTVVSMTLASYDSPLLIASCVSSGSINVIVVNLTSATHSTLQLNQMLPSFLMNASLIPDCPLMTFRQIDGQAVFSVNLKLDHETAIATMMVGADEQSVQFSNATAIDAEYGSCTQQLLGQDENLVMITDKGIVFLD
eukprot:TRINITY_DN12285_c0_g1_i10.p1 TRINITY_DN12285_c0_g1~~TRINITY_DN12285_c0_g1_i10.p1  ORF type:complete len:449 (+),score=73.07 TRINITY_DN12285_c0_g1_i10:102-1448(+)